MGYLKAVLLAVVEGATEFIPVSSTGHLILVNDYVQLTNDPSFNSTFIVAIQLPAILAVVAYFRRELWPFGQPIEQRDVRLRLWATVIVGFLPAAVLGVLLNDLIESAFENPIGVASALLIGGVLLILIERRRPAPTTLTVHDIGYVKAFYIGLFQCLAMFPGTSRSAATIIGARLLGTSRPAAAEFSFILAIPTMLGATVVKVGALGARITAYEWSLLAVGSVVSFLVAYSVVAGLMNYVQRRDFQPFGWYRIALGAAVLIHHYFLQRGA